MVALAYTKEEGGNERERVERGVNTRGMKDNKDGQKRN